MNDDEKNPQLKSITFNGNESILKDLNLLEQVSFNVKKHNAFLRYEVFAKEKELSEVY